MKARVTSRISQEANKVTMNFSSTTRNLWTVTRSGKVDHFHTDKELVEVLSKAGQIALRCKLHPRLSTVRTMPQTVSKVEGDPHISKLNHMLSVTQKVSFLHRHTSIRCSFIIMLRRHRIIMHRTTLAIQMQALIIWRVTRRPMEISRTRGVASVEEPCRQMARVGLIRISMALVSTRLMKLIVTLKSCCKMERKKRKFKEKNLLSAKRKR
jgi:hypothetical protein